MYKTTLNFLSNYLRKKFVLYMEKYSSLQWKATILALRVEYESNKCIVALSVVSLHGERTIRVFQLLLLFLLEIFVYYAF